MTINSPPPAPQPGLADRLMALFWRKPADTLAERTRRRVALHLIPFLFFLYILAYLDRVNVSVAQLKMELPPEAGGMGFSREAIGFGAGLFFLGYWLLEIPSTVSVAHWGARWVFVRILVLWGICAALVGGIGTPFGDALFAWLPRVPEHSAFGDGLNPVLQPLLGWAVNLLSSQQNPGVVPAVAGYVNGLHDNPAYQFYFFRFMLGFFEGGFFPSVIVYLSLWFRARDRAKAIAGFMSAIPLSSMLGVPVSGLLLEVHWLGLAGWRWIFILEGVAPVFAGIATLFFLPDGPTKAAWLPPAERDWLLAELEQERQSKQGHGHAAWVRHLGLVLLLTLVYFCQNVTSYGLSMFMPGIIKSQSGLSDRAASLLSSLPYVMGLLAMFVNGWHSDRTNERPWHVAVPVTLLSAGIWLAAALDGRGALPVLVMIFCVGTFMYAHLPAFWPIPTMFLGATAAASAIGFINMVGNLGGFFGPAWVGSVANGQESFAPALFRLAPFPLVGAVIILVVGYFRKKYPAGAAPVVGAPPAPRASTAIASPPK